MAVTQEKQLLLTWLVPIYLSKTAFSAESHNARCDFTSFQVNLFQPKIMSLVNSCTLKTNTCYSGLLWAWLHSQRRKILQVLQHPKFGTPQDQCWNATVRSIYPIKHYFQRQMEFQANLTYSCHAAMAFQVLGLMILLLLQSMLMLLMGCCRLLVLDRLGQISLSGPISWAQGHYGRRHAGLGDSSNSGESMWRGTTLSSPRSQVLLVSAVHGRQSATLAFLPHYGACKMRSSLPVRRHAKFGTPNPMLKCLIQFNWAACSKADLTLSKFTRESWSHKVIITIPNDNAAAADALKGLLQTTILAQISLSRTTSSAKSHYARRHTGLESSSSSRWARDCKYPL